MATVIYEVSLKDVKDYYEDTLFMSYLINEDGFNAFDIEDNLPGSLVEGDILYLLVTDYNPVVVNGEEIEYIEDILDFSIEDLRNSELIEPATDDVIKRYLSSYELAPFDFDMVATDLVQTDGYTFTEVLRAANDEGFSDDLDI